jgi:chromosome segregation ATPase
MSNVYKKQIGGDHYQSMEIQPSEFINKNNLPFAEGNAIKYLCRHKQKGQKQDLEKAIHYCQMAIDRDYPKKEKTVSEKLQDELEPIKDFLEEAEKEKKELEESYKESRRQTEERKSKEWLKGYKKWNKNNV